MSVSYHHEIPTMNVIVHLPAGPVGTLGDQLDELEADFGGLVCPPGSCGVQVGAPRPRTRRRPRPRPTR